MDNTVKEVFEFAKFQKTLQNQRDILKLKLESYLTFGYNGGLFKANPETIQFVKLLIDEGNETHPLLDLNDNPILIEDLKDLLTILLGRYKESTNEYYAEYSKLKKARNTKALVDG